jgi:structural maintenance of chromosome 3 (chondroitin sulfate proteoglycan 6)
MQVVVDDDHVGLKLVELLNKQGRGRVTFMPLNRLQAPDVAYPRQWGRDVEPLHKYMKCQDKYAKAVQQVGACNASLPVMPVMSRDREEEQQCELRSQ